MIHPLRNKERGGGGGESIYAYRAKLLCYYFNLFENAIMKPDAYNIL